MTTVLPRPAATLNTPPSAQQIAAVGRWARDQHDACERTPREILGLDGAFHPNPARSQARHEAERALASAAEFLQIPISQVGPCARCQTRHHRYGVGGRALCPDCRSRQPRGEKT